jgi:HSP20 family molecular chaperone IbpA
MSLETQDTLKQPSESPDGAERVSARPVYRPTVDILETEKAVILMADVPGVDEAGADITLDKNVLTITGKVSPPQFEGYGLAHCEYGVGDFERSFTISNEIDREGIEASVRDGVLSVTLPKSKQAVAKKISVKAGA